jgi:serine/threonine protein kinase
VSEAVERIGAYEVVGLIARGGMATVYQARQPALGRTVALKRLDLRTSDPSLVERFIRESRIAASFDRPNIVTVFDFFEWDGVPYIAMEHLPRGSLRPWIGRLDLCQNVLVTSRGAVKIADFGIAKAYTATTGGFTQTGMAVGTRRRLSRGHRAGRSTSTATAGAPSSRACRRGGRTVVAPSVPSSFPAAGGWSPPRCSARRPAGAARPNSARPSLPATSTGTVARISPWALRARTSATWGARRARSPCCPAPAADPYGRARTCWLARSAVPLRRGALRPGDSGGRPRRRPVRRPRHRRSRQRAG